MRLCNLKIFDDKTYEFYDKFIESEPSSIGKYHYDANKVLESIINQEPKNSDKNKYIIVVGDNRYYVDNDHKEIKKLIHSIFLYPLRVNLDKCPS